MRSKTCCNAVSTIALRAALGLPAAVATMLVPMAAHAQSGVAQYDIAPQSLASALDAFTRISGMSLVYDGTLPNTRSNGAEGKMSAPEALSRLLTGTGLTFRMLDSSSFTLIEAPRAQGSAIELGPVRVSGESGMAAPGRASAWDPVPGFVAPRTATATKTDTPVNETPQSITIVTRDQIDAQGAQTIPQALLYTAGVQVDRNGADQRADYIFSRGFAVDQYVDGTRLLQGVWAVPQIDSFALERVEILKGPASVLYGQAAPGGIANYITRRPQPVASGEIQLQAGNRDRFQGAIDVTGPLGEDSGFSYRLTALARTADVQVDHFRERRLLIAPALAWRDDDRTEILLRGEYLHDPESGAYYKLPAYGTVLPSPYGKISTSFDVGDPDFSRHEREQMSLSYNLSHSFSDALKLSSSGRYMRVNGDYDVIVFQRLQADLKTMNRMSYRAAETLDAWTSDNRFETTFSTGAIAHHILTGFDYQGQTTDRQDSFGTAPTLDITNPVYGQQIGTPDLFLDQRQTQHQYGLYLQDQISLGGLRLVIGGRQDWARTRTYDRLYSTTDIQKNNAFTWRAGLLYAFDNGLSPYASYTESFQPVAGTDFFGDPFQPTTGRQFEAGLKYTPDDHFSLTASAYHLRQRNVLTADPDQDHIAVNPNAQVQTGEVTSKGFEVEAKATLVNGLSLTAAYAYVDSETTRSNDGLVGKTPVYQPAHNASLWADYAMRNGLRLGAGVRYFGKTWGAADNSFRVPDFAVVDALAAVDLGALTSQLYGFDISVNARNLLDKTYVTGCQNINTCYYGTRRTVFATLRYRW